MLKAKKKLFHFDGEEGYDLPGVSFRTDSLSLAGIASVGYTRDTHLSYVDRYIRKGIRRRYHPYASVNDVIYRPAGKLPAICGPQGRVGRPRRPESLAGQRTAAMNANGSRGGSNRCDNQPLSRPA
eukprot:scaffold160954_cov16-Prasinocladus_malaysianus.AAC.1